MTYEDIDMTHGLCFTLVAFVIVGLQITLDLYGIVSMPASKGLRAGETVALALLGVWLSRRLHARWFPEKK